MSIRNLLDRRLRDAATSCGIAVSPTDHLAAPSTRPEFGDFQANLALTAAREMKAKPRDLAERIVAQAQLADIASRVEIAGPGFINIHLADDFLARLLDDLHGAHRLCPLVAHPVRTVVDYSSPNLAKEMHVGHLRSTIIGDAVVRVLEYLGHEVIRHNHMGDWGTQFGMLIAELEDHLGTGAAPDLALADLEQFYQNAKAHFDLDAEFATRARHYVVRLQAGDAHCHALWQRFIAISIAHSEAIYRQLNVTLSHTDIRPESAYNDDLAEIAALLTEKGLAVEDEGALVAFLPELADKQGRPSPVIVRKSDGGYLYATTDLAALRYRSQMLGAKRILYFIDARQSLHMKQVFTLARKAGLVGADVALEHHPFGTMLGPDGTPFKTRSGGTVKLAGLLDEAVSRAAQLVAAKNPALAETTHAEIAHKVGIGAVKYADLAKTRTHDYVFDWDSMLSFDGNTAPYLQYAYTRIQSIFRRAADIAPDATPGTITITTAAERRLALALLGFGEVLHQVAAEAYPHVLCNYLYELASTFTGFYEQCPILKPEIAPELRASRLALCQLAARTLATGLDLLGIEVMAEM